MTRSEHMIVTPGIGGTNDVYCNQVLPLVLNNVCRYLDGRPSDLRNIMRWSRACVSGWIANKIK